MSTSNSSDVAIAQIPSYPTFEELRSAQTVVLKSSAGERIFWILHGPFTAAISVMKDRHNPTSLTPYFSNGTWHPISQQPVSEPKVSSITVYVEELEQWEYLWKDSHNGHGEIGIPGKGRWYGNLEDYDPEEDSDREEHLLGCCGEPRPRKKKARIVVRAASGGFVTVHDYLSTLHPWLMGLKGNIVSSNELWDCDLLDMVVVFGWLDCLGMEEKADWIRHVSKVLDLALLAAHANREWPEFGPEYR